MHLDDIRDSMLDGRPHFEYLARWLERHDALIVRTSPVTVPNGFMPGTFTSRPGRWGQDEPLPPYDRHRRLIEEALATPPEQQ